MNLEVRDKLYYDDLIYYLCSLSNLEVIENKETEIRILKRLELKIVPLDTPMVVFGRVIRTTEVLSEFNKDIILIVREIYKRASVNVIGLRNMIPYPYFVRIASGISKYPELVKEILIELENEKNKLYNSNTNKIISNGPKLIKKLNLDL